MGHADNGTLMAYLDGELPVRDRSAIDVHLRDCGTCASDLEEIVAMATEFSAAIALADGQIPMLRARARIAAAGTEATPQPARRRRMMVTGGMLKAAAVVLLLAGAASAAIPGTPLRRLIENVVEKTATLFGTDTQSVPVVQVPETIVPPPVASQQRAPGGSAAITPSGSARVSIHNPAGDSRISVRLVDSNTLRASSVRLDNASFTSGTNHIDVFQSTAGLIVEVPRGLARLTIDVDGEVFFVKDDAGARLLVPGADSGSDEFVFQARSR